MTVLLIAQVIIVASLIGVILMQPSAQDGFTGSSNTSTGFMSGRAQANIMTKLTSILATLFIVNSLVLAYLATQNRDSDDIIDTITQEQEEPKSLAPEAAKDLPAELPDTVPLAE